MFSFPDDDLSKQHNDYQILSADEDRPDFSPRQGIATDGVGPDVAIRKTVSLPLLWNDSHFKSGEMARQNLRIVMVHE